VSDRIITLLRIDAIHNLCDDHLYRKSILIMIARRRPKRKPPTRSAQPAAGRSVDIQRALRLGWAIAETFGRLRSYQPEFANKRNDPHEMPRFSYSNSDLSGAQQLEVSFRRLVELAGALGLPSPNSPDLAMLLDVDRLSSLDDDTIKRVHGTLEAWSRQAWVQLNVRSASLGRAMTYGGSLADTYWYAAKPGTEAFVRGRQSVEALLRPHRLRRMQERMDEIAGAFSDEMCDAIGHSLSEWMFDDRKNAWAEASDWRAINVAVGANPSRTPAQQLHFNLFRQVRTWRDLLFEARQPLDYVSPGFRRRANLLAGTITILMVLAVAVLVGVLVFAILNLALDFVRNRPGVVSQFGNELIEAVSVFITVASTLAVVIAGLLSRASRAVEQFDAWLENAIIRRRIRRETTVPWNDPPRRSET
jgi:hypothetical protein